MPRVKFDYIVSFSSEDPEYPASNLLSSEVSKKKWLCAAGETSASVVLQLDKAVQIGTVAVGGHHAALVEVLVGRSETPAEPFQVLVASCVFLSPSESRKAEGAAVERVRTFSGTEGPWAQRWDRLRLLVSQPYNKHCKFGVSFVHVFSPDAVPARPVTTPEGPSPKVVPAPLRSSLVTALDALSSDEDEFKPGELFAQHKMQTDSTTDTGSQIRRATSQLLRTSTDADGTGTAQLVKTPRNKRTDTSNTHATDTAPHDDNVGSRNDRTIDTTIKRDNVDRTNRYTKRKRDSREPNTDRKRRRDSSSRERGTSGSGREPDTNSTSPGHTNQNKERTKTDMSKQKPCGVGAGAGAVLAGVVCVLSGYEHPRRGAVRRAALALGARVLRDWDETSTHLICAFPGTPKLRAVRGGAGGARVPAVLADWVEQCARLRRRLPEEWFSTEPARRVPAPPGALDDAGESDDTDDEIDRVLRQQRDTPPPTTRDTDGSADHRAQRPGSEGEGEATDVEAELGAEGEGEVAVEGARALPPILRDMVFVSGAALVDRYVRAYGGTVLPVEEAGAGGGEVYALCEDGAGAGVGAEAGVRRLRLRWLWRAHAERRLPPIHRYIID